MNGDYIYMGILALFVAVANRVSNLIERKHEKNVDNNRKAFDKVATIQKDVFELRREFKQKNTPNMQLKLHKDIRDKLFDLSNILPFTAFSTKNEYKEKIKKWIHFLDEKKCDSYNYLIPYKTLDFLNLIYIKEYANDEVINEYDELEKLKKDLIE